MRHVDPTPEVPGWDLEPPWHTEPLTHQRGPISDRGDARAPAYGAGYEQSAGEPRVARHELTYGYHDPAGFAEDHMTGVHGLIANVEADHYGYQEPWGVEVPIARQLPTQAWDAGAEIVSAVPAIPGSI